MPILAENFVANSLSGTVFVTDGFANLNLTTNPYVLEGDKSFVIKIRKGGIDGLVIASSPVITLRDNSEFVSLTANVSTVAEGNLVSFTLVTANAADNSNVYYSILPVTANVNAQDFVGANVGKATIFNNQAVFSYFANADYSLVDETGETFKVQLRTNSTTGNIIYSTSNVVITDFYKRFNVFGVVPNNSTISQGDSATFTVSAHNVPVGTLLYYYTSGNASVVGSNVGSIVMNGVSNTITLASATDIPSGQSRILTLNIAETNLGTPLATSNPVTVAAFFIASGGTETISGGYKIHTFTTSGTFTVSSNGGGTADVLVVAGGGGGGSINGGGGGGGGLLYGTISLAANTYNIVIGGGGAASAPGPATPNRLGGKGGNTALGSFIALGGGGGSGNSAPYPSPTISGGSGGGASAPQPAGGVGSQPPQGGLTGYGNPGGSASGGGAGSAGFGGSANVGGGRGLLVTIVSPNAYYSNGGGGSVNTANARYVAGATNTGTGGAGSGPGLAGGSGIVIIRYPFA